MIDKDSYFLFLDSLIKELKFYEIEDSLMDMVIAERSRVLKEVSDD